MAILTVTKANGTVVNLPDPSGMVCDIYDVDASTSGRSQDGNMFRDRVGVKRKVNCTWQNIDSANVSVLLNAVTDVFFQLTYPDALTNENRTMTCYIGDRSADNYTLADGRHIYGSFTMNFIER